MNRRTNSGRWARIGCSVAILTLGGCREEDGAPALQGEEQAVFVEHGPLAIGSTSDSTDATHVASLIMAFLLGFYLEATLGMVGFWFLEVSSLLFVYMLFSFFFSGHMFPIDMLPGVWGTVVKLIPLQYLAYFPAAVFLGKVQGAALVEGLAIQAAWVVVFIIASRVTFRLGVRRYSGYGG